jgi:uncharacterized phiE125 gp8 family phage protein
MSLVLTAGPSAEPVSLAEAKAHLRVTSSSEDALIASLLAAARVHLERSLSRAFLSQSWSLFLDRWPAAYDLELPLAPVLSIAAIRVAGPGSNIVTLAAGDYRLDGQAVPPRIVRTDGARWSAAALAPAQGALGIEIAFVAGHGTAATDVPAQLRQAILLLLAHWFEGRSPIELGATGAPLPEAIAVLVQPYRQVRL